MNFSPSKQQLEDIAARWANRESIDQICYVYGVTRGVISGVIHRNGFTRPGGAGVYVRKKPAPKPAQTPRPKGPPPGIEPDIDLTADEKLLVGIMDLDRSKCAYEVIEVPRLYCGRKTNGSPFCEGHARLVYQPQIKKNGKPRL